MPKRQCEITGCGEQIDPGRLMCRDHWLMAPKSLRDAVWAAWRDFDPSSRESIQRYRDARDAAVGYVQAKLGVA